MTADSLLAPPAFDLKKAVMQDKLQVDDDDDDDDDDDSGDMTFAEALEDAIVDLGYDGDDARRRKLAAMLGAAVDGNSAFPEDIRSRVIGATGMGGEAVDAALKRVARPALAAVKAAIAYQEERREELEELDDGEREEALNDEARIMERLRTMGPCPAGFAWFRQGNGWRCGGGSHFVYDDDPILNFD